MTAALCLARVSAQPPNLDSSCAKNFSSQIMGDWVGVRDQTADGVKVPIQYFRLNVRRTSDESFSSRISYFRYDDKASELRPCGEDDIVTDIGKDGTGASHITGTCEAYVNGSPKPAKHTIDEIFKMVGKNRLEGSGRGSVSVTGTPLGMGKNGKISKSTTVWLLSEDTLTIRQHTRAKFSFLCFGKSCEVESTYNAHRGTDLASLMKK